MCRPGFINVVHGRGAHGRQARWPSSPRIGMISFTGSVETGSAIMAAAAENITKVNLELGGKAPAIVMADADIDLAVQAIKCVARHQQRPGLQLRRARVRAAQESPTSSSTSWPAAMSATHLRRPAGGEPWSTGR